MFSSRAYRRCHVLYSSVRGGAYCMLCAPTHASSACRWRWFGYQRLSNGIAARPRRARVGARPRGTWPTRLRFRLVDQDNGEIQDLMGDSWSAVVVIHYDE